MPPPHHFGAALPNKTAPRGEGDSIEKQEAITGQAWGSCISQSLQLCKVQDEPALGAAAESGPG